MHRIKNIFLDRDGTLIELINYLSDPNQIRILPGVIRGLSAMSAMGCAFFMVSNQSGIGRGYFRPEQVDAVNARLFALLSENGLKIKDSLYCPSDPDQGECRQRKPEIGMWETLRDKYGLRPESSLMVGDNESDLGFGQNAAFAAACLVLSGHGPETAAKHGWTGQIPLAEPFSLQNADREDPTRLVLVQDLLGVAAYVGCNYQMHSRSSFQ